ncbi:MAG: hypothetical protein ABT940_00575 [Alphaproteobacteria bacterium]
MITTKDATDEVGQPTAQTEGRSRLSQDQVEALGRLAQRRGELDPERRAMVEALAPEYNIPLPPVQGFSQIKDPRREQMSEFGEAARVAALPMGGQLVGGALGLMAGGPVGEMAGQSVGGIAGLMANRALGISKPDATDAALTGAAPVAGKLATVLGRKAIPGHAAAEQQIGAELIRETPKLLPGDASTTKAAYDKVNAMGSPTLQVPNFSKTVDELADVEQTKRKYGAAVPSLSRSTTKAQTTLQAQGGTMPFEDAAVLLKGYRQKVAGLEAKGGEEYGAYKALRKSLFADMDAAEKSAAAAGQNVTALREAMKAAKQSIAKEEFGELLEKYGVRTIEAGGQVFEVIDPVKMLNKLKSIDFKDSVGAGTYAKIEQTMKELAKIPKPDGPGGAGIGTFKRVVAMGGAAALGATHGPAGAFGASMAAAGTIAAHDAAASLMMSDKGRNFLVKMFKANRGKMGERTGQLLQFAASQFQDTGDE